MIFRVPAMDRVLSDTHGFPEVAAEDIALDIPLLSLPRSTYYPSYRNAPEAFAEIVGATKPKDYVSFSAASSVALHEEVELLRHLKRTGNLPALGACWRTQFLKEGSIVRCNKGPWYLVVGLVLLAAVLWPLRIRSENGMEFAYFKETEVLKELLLKPVVDFSEWEVRPSQWLSPLELFVRGKKKIALKWAGVCAVRLSMPVLLLRHCASFAFWDMTQRQVKMLCEQDFPDISTKVPFFDLLLSVIIRILACSEAAALTILEKRALRRGQDAVEEAAILNDPDFEDNLDSRDAKTVRDEQVRSQEETNDKEALRHYIKRKRFPPKAPGGKPKGAGKADPVKKKFKGSTTIPKGPHVSESEAAKLLPDESRIHKDGGGRAGSNLYL